MPANLQKKYTFFKFITNKYFLILLFFVLWMLFFDQNSYLTHHEFNKKIQALERSIHFYEGKVQENKILIKNLQDSLKLRRYAREKYLLKKENEDIYLIEFDTITK